MLSYKHWIWSVLMWVGIIASGLAVITNPAWYGLPIWIMPYIRLAAFIAAIVGGKLGKSYLPKEG